MIFIGFGHVQKISQNNKKQVPTLRVTKNILYISSNFVPVLLNRFSALVTVHFLILILVEQY